MKMAMMNITMSLKPGEAGGRAPEGGRMEPDSNPMPVYGRVGAATRRRRRCRFRSNAYSNLQHPFVRSRRPHKFPMSSFVPRSRRGP